MGKKCCNPFNKSATLPEQHLWKFPELNKSDYICSLCRKQLQSYEPPKKDNDIQESEPVSETPDSQGSTAEFSNDDMNMDVFLGVSPVKKKRTSHEAYMGSKLQEMQEAVREKFKSQFHVSPRTETDKIVHDRDEIIQNIKAEVQNSKERSRIIELLSLLPQSWSRKNIVEEFGVSDHCAKKAKSLRENRRAG
ncbi:hypothetical protein QAD02_022040 [Eretmocerus hayati]|uniref:Uncharacterized protein n=1 Tax=Eretmocerus hayati TaxID=131215 RepID=A0ACC2PTY2_9HYME|nr:hypothetical protein QAD02_022040 [Eretmocerus hayati]